VHFHLENSSPFLVFKQFCEAENLDFMKFKEANEELTLGIADWWLYGIIEMVLVVDAISLSVSIKRLLW
jgi:hypothetical protein